jgi:hypothetical protein
VRSDLAGLSETEADDTDEYGDDARELERGERLIEGDGVDGDDGRGMADAASATVTAGERPRVPRRSTVPRTSSAIPATSASQPSIRSEVR